MRLALGVALALLLFGSTAAADPSALTAFERQTLDECAARLGAAPEIDAEAEGKRIERIDIVVLDVFDEHDPVPDFVNVFHTMTKTQVIRRELLFHEGGSYVGARVDESARNLRQLSSQLSLVLALPLRGSTPGSVRVIVIVKDVWSLRLNNHFTVSSYGLQELTLMPSEQNLAGLHTIVAAQFELEPATYAWGGLVAQRRILGTSLDATLSSSIVYNRDHGDAEGSRGSFVFGNPLRRASQRWAYGVGLAWDDEMVRHFLPNGLPERYDSPATPENDALRVEYRGERYLGGYEAVRSFGSIEKYDLSFGVEVDRRLNRHEPLPWVSGSAERDFLAQWVPRSDTRASPFVQLRTHVERYLHTAELETLALEEDFRLGPEALLRVYPASKSVGSSRDLIGSLGGGSMTWRVGDGLVRVIGENRLEYADHGHHDADAVAEARFASPRTGFGRLILNGLIHARYENYLNRFFELGGDTRLRGYPQAGYAGSLKGPLAVALNAEFRTPSVDILSMHTGLAAFFDAGDAGTRFRDLYLRQSAGLGLRVLFPQFDRVVLRGDWAFPFEPPHGYRTFPGTFYVAYEQAFGMPALESPTVMAPVAR
jgi:hypothetical protein